MHKLNFFLQLTEKQPCEGSGGKAAQVSPTQAAEAGMNHDAKLLRGSLSVDVPAAWHDGSSPPFSSSPPCVSCVGSQREREATVLPDFAVGWSHCKSHVCGVPVMGVLRLPSVGLEEITSFLDLWHLTATRRDKNAFGLSLCR